MKTISLFRIECRLDVESLFKLKDQDKEDWRLTAFASISHTSPEKAVLKEKKKEDTHKWVKAQTVQQPNHGCFPPVPSILVWAEQQMSSK